VTYSWAREAQLGETLSGKVGTRPQAPAQVKAYLFGGHMAGVGDSGGDEAR